MYGFITLETIIRNHANNGILRGTLVKRMVAQGFKLETVLDTIEADLSTGVLYWRDNKLYTREGWA